MGRSFEFIYTVINVFSPRAIICVKSGEICMESHRGGTGQLLHDLEEKMEVARVQLQILETMNR